MNINLNNKDVYWGYFSQFMYFGASLILLPFALAYLTIEEMGFWYIFLAITALVQLLEFGFQPTISRLTSYIYAGANSLNITGLPEKKEEKKININLLHSFILGTKKIYMIISFFAGFFMFTIGTYYLLTIAEFSEDILYSWIIYVLAIIINFYFTYLNGLMQGRGQQTSLNKILSLSKIAQVLITMALFYLEFGLISMSIGLLISTVVARVLMLNSFNSNSYPETHNIKINDETIPLLALIYKSSFKLGLTQFGAFMITRGNLFIATSFLGIKVTAQYGITLQVIGVLTQVSYMIVSLNMPKMNYLQAKYKEKEVLDIFIKTLSTSLLIFITGSFFIVLTVPFFISLFSSEITMLPISIVIFILIVQLLELNHYISGNYFTTKNEVPFYKAWIITGFFIIAISIIFMKFYSFGIFGLIFSHFICQLVYNNWKWPYLVINEYRRINDRI